MAKKIKDTGVLYGVKVIWRHGNGHLVAVWGYTECCDRNGAYRGHPIVFALSPDDPILITVLHEYEQRKAHANNYEQRKARANNIVWVQIVRVGDLLPYIPELDAGGLLSILNE